MRADLSARDFTSTFRSWAVEKAHVSDDVAEMTLAHNRAGQAQGAYRAGGLIEQRQELFKGWRAYCLMVLQNSVLTLGAREAVR
jgi:hypothetical protein